MQEIRPDRRRVSTGELIVAVAGVVLMVGIFLPWFEFGDALTGSYSFDATSLRTWMYIPFFVSLAVVAWVVVRVVWHRPRLPVPAWLLLVGACGVDLVLTLGCFVKKSSGLHWDVGAYVSVVAAFAALVGALVSRSSVDGVGHGPVGFGIAHVQEDGATGDGGVEAPQ
jgi:hypothetical protein